MDDFGLVAQFAPEYVDSNYRAIDWGNEDIIAFASGCCIHLGQQINGKLSRMESVEFPSSPIRTISFHKDKSLIAIGDDVGKVYVYDYKQRKIKCAVKPTRTDQCCKIMWREDYLLVLAKSGKFTCFSFTPKTEDDNYTATIKWNLKIAGNYSNFTIDKYEYKQVIFYGTSKTIAIYNLENANKLPTTFEKITLNDYDEVQDIQFSIHLPNYAYVVLQNEIYYFHLTSKSLIPIGNQRSSSSHYCFISQFLDNHNEFLAFHKNGSISYYESVKPGHYKVKTEIMQRFRSEKMSGCVFSPLESSKVAFYYRDLGVAISNTETMRIESTLFVFPSKVTSYDSDGEIFVYGTSDGFIITGSTRAWEPRRFKVSDFEVSFVSLNLCNSGIFWAAGRQLGEIDLARNAVHIFHNRPLDVKKCFASRHGGLVVQRDERTLGVFIGGREHPVIARGTIADVTFDEDSSNGTFCVLLESQEIYFYECSDRIKEVRAFKASGIDASAVCFASGAGGFVTGFDDGTLLILQNGHSIRVDTKLENIRNLRYKDNVIYGIGGESTVFEFDVKLSIWNLELKDFQVSSRSLFLARGIDDIVRFVRIKERMPLSFMSKAFPFEPQKIKKPFVADFEKIVQGKDIARLQIKAGSGRQLMVEEVNNALLERVHDEDGELLKQKYTSMLFCGLFGDAADLISAHPQNFLLSTMFAGFLYAIEDGANERVLLHLKSAAMQMIDDGDYETAALLLRIGRLDRLAASYMLDGDQKDLALKFVRCCLDEKDRKILLFRLGCTRLREHEYEDAALTFAAADQIHASLFSAAIADNESAKSILQFLQSEYKERLVEIDKTLVDSIPGIISLEELIEKLSIQKI